MPRFSFGKTSNTVSDPTLNKMFANPQIEDMLCKSEWLWNQYIEKGREKPTQEECTYSVACLIKVVELLVVRKEIKVSQEAASPNKKVIITKTGKVIELSDESDNMPVNSKKNEVSVIEHINNIAEFLKDRKEDNIAYVKNYIEEWVEFLMQNKFDKDSLLTIFDAEEVRARTLQTLKRLNYDMVSM